MIKNTIFNNIIKNRNKKIQFSIIELRIEIKTTAATALIKIELNYFPMSEGCNTCLADPNLEVLATTLDMVQYKGLVYFLFVKSLNTYVWSGDTFLKWYCLTNKYCIKQESNKCHEYLKSFL